MLDKLHHTGIWVSDIDKILPFYRDILGMNVALDSGILEGPIVDTLTGIPNSQVRALFLEKSGQSWEFLQLVSPHQEVQPNEGPYARVGRGHACFETDDIEGTYENLKSKGVKFVCEPQAMKDLKMFYFEDPEGNRLEVVELYR